MNNVRLTLRRVSLLKTNSIINDEFYRSNLIYYKKSCFTLYFQCAKVSDLDH